MLAGQTRQSVSGGPAECQKRGCIRGFGLRLLLRTLSAEKHLRPSLQARSLRATDLNGNA